MFWLAKPLAWVVSLLVLCPHVSQLPSRSGGIIQTNTHDVRTRGHGFHLLLTIWFKTSVSKICVSLNLANHQALF